MAINVRIYQYSARLSIFGRFEFNAHRDFKHAYMPLLHNTALREIDIEMNKVDYMDSSALGMLMLLHERAQTAHKTVSLINASSAVAQFLEVANFNHIFNIKRTSVFNPDQRNNACLPENRSSALPRLQPRIAA